MPFEYMVLIVAIVLIALRLFTSRKGVDLSADDTGDPIGDSERRMAYGLYEEAYELVEGAIAENPRDPLLKAKLLEILFVWGNEEAFLEKAQRFQRDLDSEQWEIVSIMGQQLHPEEPLFK